MKPQDIHILHLSDLHFEKEISRPVFDVVLNDIKDQLGTVERLVVVVTGDIISQAAFGKNAKNAISFFRRLKSKVPKNSLELIEIVPGNHDFERPKIVNEFNKGNFSPDYSGFRSLSEKIYGAMGFCPKDRYGVSCVEYCESIISFVRVDTSSILSIEDMEKEIRKNIKEENAQGYSDEVIRGIISKRQSKINEDIECQKKAILKEYGKVVRKVSRRSPLVTFALSHYPLSWLNETGHEKLKETLFERGLEFVDVWLCGHLHDAQLYYTNDNGRQTAMLMSGIGRKENPQDLLRYSIYTISPLRNVCEVQIRVFADERLDEDRCSHKSLPLKAKSIGSVIPLNHANTLAKMGYYVDESTLDLLRFVSSRMIEFDRRLGELLDEYKNLPEIKEKFGEVLRVISSNILYHFSPTYIKGKVEFPNFNQRNSVTAAKWRVHFRKIKIDYKKRLVAPNANVYVPICPWTEQIPRPARWDTLIRAAYRHEKKSLVSSANKDVDQMDTSWDEFLTAVPNVSGNSVQMDSGESRPLLVFGISVAGDNYESTVVACRTLYLLEYFDVNEVVSHWIEKYLKLSGLCLKDCLEGLK